MEQLAGLRAGVDQPPLLGNPASSSSSSEREVSNSFFREGKNDS